MTDMIRAWLAVINEHRGRERQLPKVRVALELGTDEKVHHLSKLISGVSLA